MALTRGAVAKALAALALAAAFLHTASFDLHLIRYPYPLQWRELSEVYTAQLVAHGQDPYVLSRSPLAAQVYGVGQALLCAPFVRLHGGADFFILRLVNGCFLLGAAWVIYAWGRLGSTRLPAAAAALLCYTLWMAQGLPTSKPEGPGLFFFLLSLYLPIRHRYSARSLAASIALGLAAYYTKPYFLLGSILVGPLLWWRRGLRAALLYTGAWLAAATASALAAGLLMPLYHYETFFSFFNNYAPAPSWAWQQLGDLEGMIPLLLLGLPLALTWSLLRRRRLDGPGEGLGEAEACFLAMAYVAPFKMSVHSGVYLTYLLELLVPFLALLALAAFNRAGTHWAVACLLLGASAVTAGGTIMTPFAYGSQPRIAMWQAVDGLLDPAKRVLVTGPAAALAYAKGMPFQDTGLTEYPGMAQAGGWNNRFEGMQALRRACDAYESDIRAKVAQGYYDRIVTGCGYLYFPQEAARHYALSDSFHFDFDQTNGAYQMEVWDRVR